MKTQKRLKRITALLMCAVLLATSLPIALAAGETAYNPAPYFTDEAQKQGAAAWMDTSGNLQVRFPEAVGRPTYADWKTTHDSTQNPKSIAYYIVELSNIGAKLTKHKATPDILLTKKVEVDAGAEGLAAVDSLTAVFTESELEALGAAFNTEIDRYNVSITAVDTEGWFSLTMDALVSEVPEFNYDMSGFELFTESDTAMREMLRFETDGKYTDTLQVGDSATQLVYNSYNGAADPITSIPTSAFRVRVDAVPGAGGQSIDTPVSRQAYDFSGASEVWYWLDLTDVELQGLSFRLRANYKRIDYNLRNASASTSEHHSNVVYSTTGSQYHTYAAGEEPYVLVQQDNGTWQKVMMPNGTVTLGHFKGYVRIPIQFFCSETSSTINTNSSAVFGVTKGTGNQNSFYNDDVCLGDNGGTSYNTGVFPETSTVEIDPVGTPITEALLIQQGRMYYRRAVQIGDDTYSFDMGSFLAPGIVGGDITKTTANNARRAYVQKDGNGNWVVQNRENGYKALEDLYSAGLAYQSVTADSVHHSFFWDNVMFMRNDGGTWVPNDLNGVTSSGTPVSDFFNQKTNAQDHVLDAIEAYIGEPSWTDYRGVHYVENMIESTAKAFADKGATYAQSFLTDAEMEARAAAVGRSDVWANYKEAIDLCKEYGTYETNNSKPDELVPSIVQLLDTIPAPDKITTVSDDELKLLIRLYQSYTSLNYAQLKMLGSYVDPVTGAKFEEEKLLAYISFLGEQMNESFVTGYKVANYPFIPFNTFETATVGDEAWRLEDDINYNSTSDYRHTKGLTTYATNKWADFTTGGSSMNASLSGAVQNRPHVGDTVITENGYNGSKGATSTITSKWLDGVETYYCVLMSKNSVSANTHAELKANNMSAENLGGLALNNDDALQSDNYLPLSLVMYVDFTEFKDSDPDFYFVPTIHTAKSDGSDVYARPRMGNETGIGNQAWWRYYYLLDNATGEWFKVNNGNDSNNDYYRYTSKVASDGVNLRGYKGYLAIPLLHFKLTNTSGNLDRDSSALNNIYSIQFSISGGNTYGKSFTIDNVGFIYDPDYYASKGVTTSTRGDKTYAEVFRAKSTKAQEFEDKVASIDSYDTQANLQSLVAEADAIYAQLGDYQKTSIDSVIASKERLELLRTYANGTDAPEPLEHDLAWLRDKINNEWSSIPDVSNTLLPNPGFTYPADATALTPSEVNYAAFGLTAEMAQEIIDGYEKCSERLTPADYASLTADEVKILENAYAAAMRSRVTLETIGSQAESFADALQSMYTIYTDADYNGKTNRLLHAANTAADGGTARGDIVDFAQYMYDPLPYYAKTELSNGNIIKAYANMTDGIARYLANTKTVTIVKADGTSESVQAGIWKLAEKYSALYSELKTALDNKTLLDASNNNLLTRTREAIAEYNDLIPAYKNVFELYYGSEQLSDGGTYKGIKDIMDLFVRADASFADTATNESTLALTKDNIATESRTLNLNYLEEYTVAAGDNSSTYFTLKYDGILGSGVIQRHYKLKLNGTEIPSVAYDAAGIQLTDKMLGGTLKNDTYTEATPFAMTFTAELTDTELFMEQLSDLVTIVHYRTADPDKGETEPQKLGEYKLHITYTPKEAYTVTIPAEFPITWGTAETDVSYSVDCALKEGSVVSVKVSGSNKLTAEQDSAYTMDYTSQNFGSAEFKGVLNGKKPDLLPAVVISQDMWKTKPTAVYKDTLTYTVEYTSAP